ncbi:pilus assembly protein TadG-related protein [Pseudomonas sp. GD04058]|uniref:pilus assembly protein TadG-related protein n=1 Tax=Pseudomonas sp. GD04058 TaxID=2975429 RepID=UPI0024468A4E|nr:pilus assembly protein TadG-related protein [Pseudomonas sp. GD04058]MDG9881234.1 pilus assembly protein TadG-related protein [Pseudomonas sp. GD04058]
MSPRFAKRQRGAIGLAAVLTLAMALVFGLVAVDGGRLYMEQRKLQRVVDMAALEAAGQSATCNGVGPQAATLANVSASRNGFSVGNGRTLVTTCGSVTTGAASRRSFSANPAIAEAIKVDATNNVATSIASGIRSLVAGQAIPATTQLHAHAVAAAPLPPRAMLRLRSTLATVDSSKSALLNALVDPLGGRVSLNAAGWQGIANTDVKLLDFLDQLAIDVNVGAGRYDELLSKNLHATDLIRATATVLSRSGAAADVITNLGRVVVGADNSTLIKLGDILDLQNGTSTSGLDATLKAIDLVQAAVMLAAKNSAAVVQIPLSLLGLVNGTIRVKVIEPEQLSAIGNPATDVIEVHTAQVRVLASLDLPVLGTIAGLANAVLNLATPLTNIINPLLGLNLQGTLQSVGCLILVPCKVSDIQLVPDAPPHLDIGLEVASATSQVTGYSCAPNKTLTAATQTATARVAIGKFATPNDFFVTGNAAVQAIPLIDFGTNVCTKLTLLTLGCGTRVPFAGGGVGIKVNSSVVGSPANSASQFWSGATAPPNLNQPAVYQSTPGASNAVTSLGATFSGIQLLAYQPQGGNPLGQVVTAATSTLSNVVSILVPQITTLLGRITDPLINALLKVLGIDLMVTDVGANLDCSNNRAQLVL